MATNGRAAHAPLRPPDVQPPASLIKGTLAGFVWAAVVASAMYAAYLQLPARMSFRNGLLVLLGFGVASFGSLIMIPRLVTEGRQHFSTGRGVASVLLVAMVYAVPLGILMTAPQKFGIESATPSPVLAIFLWSAYRSASKSQR